MSEVFENVEKAPTVQWKRTLQVPVAKEDFALGRNSTGIFQQFPWPGRDYFPLELLPIELPRRAPGTLMQPLQEAASTESNLFQSSEMAPFATVSQSSALGSLTISSFV